MGDSEKEECLATTNLAVVSVSSQESMHKETSKQCTPVNQECFPLLQVAATRTPQLDSFIKPEVPQPVKMSDKEWARIQTFVLDALAPLMSLLEIDAKGETITHDQELEAAMAVIQLLGNASAQISHGWRTKVLTHLNKSQLLLLEEDANFEDVAPSLFGLEFVRKSKELVDQVRAIRSTTQKDGKLLFQQGQLGSLLLPPSNRRLMVGRGKKDAHQLRGVTICHSGSQIICQTQNKNFYSAKDRQHHSSGIHKSFGKYNLTRFSQVDKESVDVMPGEEYPHHSTTPPRVTEHNCRCRVPKIDGQDRLETESDHLPQDQSTLGPTGSGPFCFSAINPVPTLL